MTDVEQNRLRSYCALLLKEYGFHFSPEDPVIPALYIIHKEMQSNSESNKTLGLQLKEAADRLNPRVFTFHSEAAAFKFQLGIAVKWILVGSLVLLFVIAGLWYWSMANRIVQVNTILQTSGNMRSLMRRVKKDKEGFFFIDFTEAQGDSLRYFEQYERVNSKTVRVCLGRESR